MLTKVLVEAGAGCGKTTSIVAQFKLACSSTKEGGLGLSPQDILLLTFTEAAAKEMRARIEKQCPELDLSTGFIGTFHAFCLKLLRNSELTPVSRQKDIYSEGELSILFKARFLDQLAQNPALPQILESLSLGSIMDLVLRGSATKISIAAEFAQLHTQWETFASKLKRKLNSLDTEELSASDWPLQALELLEKHNLDAQIKFSPKKILKAITSAQPDMHDDVKRLRDAQMKGIFTPLLDEWKKEEALLTFLHEEVQKLRGSFPPALTFSEIERMTQVGLADKSVKVPTYKLIIVDEFQDTSPEQWDIVENISGPEAHWYLVGDPKQSIYAFRKADIRLYSKLREKLEIKSLEKNYRSAPELLGFVNEAQRTIFNEALDPRAQELCPGKEVACLPDPVKVLECEQISHEALAKAIRERDAQAPDLTHAILFREWKKLYAFAEYLTLNRQSFKIEGADNYLDHFLTSLFTEFLLGVFYPESDRLGMLASAGVTLSEAKIKYYREHQDYLTSFYDFCFQVQPTRWPQGAEWTSCMERFLFKAVGKGFVKWQDILQMLVKQTYDTLDLNLPREPKSEGAQITLLTVHGSKGLEFDCVYLPDPREGSSGRQSFEEDEIPFTYQVNPQRKSRSLYFELRKVDRQARNEAEQKRLFYVAITRAKRSLDFFIPFARESTRPANDCPWFEIWKGPSSGEKFKWSRVLRAHRSSKFVHWKEAPGLTNESTSAFVTPKPRVQSALKQLFPEVPEIETAAQYWGKELHKALENWNGDENNFERVVGRSQAALRSELSVALRALRRHPDLDQYWKLLAEKESEWQVFREEELVELSAGTGRIARADVLLLRAGEAIVIDWKTAQREDRFNALRLRTIEDQLLRYAGILKPHIKKINVLAIGIFRDFPPTGTNLKTLLKKQV